MREEDAYAPGATEALRDRPLDLTSRGDLRVPGTSLSELEAAQDHMLKVRSARARGTVTVCLLVIIVVIIVVSVSNGEPPV